ncbi:acyl carrier protein [Paenibacillus amylolyticus]
METEQLESPGNEKERKMLSLWSNVLQLEEDKISVLKNFFDLGGNSLKIMHLNRLIRDELEIDIPVVYMFKYTTIRSLVHFMNSGGIATGLANQDAIETSLAEGKKRMENLLRRNVRR